MKRKRKKIKYDKGKMIALFKEAGFTDDEIKDHYMKKQALAKSKKKIEKPLARIFYGLNTNSL